LLEVKNEHSDCTSLTLLDFDVPYCGTSVSLAFARVVLIGNVQSFASLLQIITLLIFTLIMIYWFICLFCSLFTAKVSLAGGN